MVSSEWHKRAQSLAQNMYDYIVKHDRAVWMQVPTVGAYTIGMDRQGLLDLCILYDGRTGSILNDILDEMIKNPGYGIHDFTVDDNGVPFRVRFEVVPITAQKLSQHFALNRDIMPNNAFVQIQLAREDNYLLPSEPGYVFDPYAPDWLFDDNVGIFYS